MRSDVKKGFQPLTFLLNAFWRALYPLNVFLFALAFFQIAVLCVVYVANEIPVPDFIAQRIKAYAEKNGVILEFSSSEIKLSGEVGVRNLSCRFLGTPEPFFKAESASVSFWTMRLFAGELKIREVKVAKGRFGPTYSSPGSSQAIENINLCIKKKGAWWHVSPMRFKLGPLGVHADGVVNENFSMDNLFDLSALSSSMGRIQGGQSGADKEAESEKLPPNVRLSSKIDSVFAKFPEARRYLDMFGHPLVRLDFTLFGVGENSVNLNFASGGAEFKIKDIEARVKDMKFDVRFNSSVGREDEIFISAFAREFSAEGYPEFKELDIRAKAVFEGDIYGLKDFGVEAKRLSFKDVTLDNLSLNKESLNERDWKRGWTAFASMGRNRFGIALSADDSANISAEISGNISPEVVLSRKELADIRELKDFSFPTGVNVEAKGAFNYETRQGWVEGLFDAADCVIMRIPAVFASGAVRYSTKDSVIYAHNLRVESFAGWGLKGSFTQNLDNYSYNIRVRGNLRPMDIAHFMEPWWTDIMGSFKFTGDRNFPNADVSVDGTWGKPENIWCFVKADGVNASYRGVMFDKFGLYVWVNPTRISLYDVTVQAGSRRAHASLEWLYGSHGLTSYEKQEIFLVSTMNTRELAALGGDEVNDIFDVVRFDNAPSLTLNAVMYNPKNNPKNLRDIFNASVFAPGDIHIETAVLKNARFNARSDKIVTNIEDATCEFCGGQAKGNVRLVKSGKGMLFDGIAEAEDMNQNGFIDFLASLGNGENGKKNGNAKGGEFLPGGENGRISINVKLRGDTEKLEKIEGDGYVHLENKDLIQLNLLGLLSRAMSAMGIPLASFDITYAASPFVVGGGKVELKKLEMGGPVMQIKGAAAYNFEKDDLDAALVIEPFAGLTTPILSSVMSLITPITSTVQVTLDGSISDPKIGITLNPLNIIQSDKKILENIRESL